MTENQGSSPFADVKSGTTTPAGNGGKKSKGPLIAIIVIIVAIAAVIAVVLGMRSCSAPTDEPADTATVQTGTDATTAEPGNTEPVVAGEGQIVVSVRVDGTEGGGQVWFDGEVAIDEGATAFEALEATGLQISSKSSLGMGQYVMGIEGLMEKEQSSRSGWLYSVNGKQASQSSDRYALEEGDSVEWYWRLDAISASN